MEILKNSLQSSALLAIFFIVYYLFLRKDTYYQLKRVYFYIGLVVSVILPWIYFTKNVIVEAKKSFPVFFNGNNFAESGSNFAESGSLSVSVPIERSIDYIQILFYAYLIITSLILMWYLFRYLRLYFELKKSYFIKDRPYKLHVAKHDIEPFSFFRHIVMSRKDYMSDNKNFILAHELAHITQWHSLDVLFINMACACFWFNPIIWLYRSHWVQNLEHIADQVTTTTTDKSAYQYLLLNRVLNNTNFQPVKNTLLQSSIKQRIMMLNKTKTPKLLSLKSLIIIPFLIVFVMNFQIKVNAQVKKPLGTGTEPNQKTYIDSVKKSTNIYDNKIIIFKITKNASQEYLNTSKSELKTSYNIDLIYTDIIYNENGELTSIHVEVDCNDGFKGTMGQTLPLGIPDLYMYRDYTDRGKSPFGVGAFSESEVQNKFSIEGQGIELIMISPDVISNQEKADIKESKNTKAKKTTEVKAVLHSVKYSDSISTTTTKYGNNSQPNFGSLSRKKQNPFDVENYTAVTNFVDDNAFVNDSLKRDEKVAVKINRLASQNYLDHTKQFLKERYNIDVNYTNVEYNDKEELISIKAKVNCNDGFTGTISRKRNQPVKEFYIFRDYSETNKAPFGIDDDLPSSFTGEKGSSNSYKTTYVLLTPPTRGLSEVHFEDLPGTSNSTTASVNRVNLEKVKTFIINDQVIKLADIKSQFLVVDSYFFVDDETFKVKGELINGDGYFDYLKSQSKDKDDVYVQNINIIIFSNNKATFLNFKDIKVTQHKSEKE